MLKRCMEIWDEVRQGSPLVHCITNYVTVNDVANIILAAGASPAMAEHPEEAGDFAQLAQGLYLNLGTLTSEQEQAMIAAAKGARDVGIPLLVDPVACGVIKRKQEVLAQLISQGRVSVIKGNGAEIKSLAGMSANARGVDSLDSGAGLDEACRNLSQEYQAVIAATGEVDVVADGPRLAHIHNGTHLFGRITGAGCMVGGVMSACLAVAPAEIWLAGITGLLAFNIAGERTIAVCGNNPGTFRFMLADQLYHLRGHDVLEEGKVAWR